jgi:beta-glucosidase
MPELAATPEAAAAIEQRAQTLLARMTLEQKIHLLHGHVPLAYTVRPLPELGIPALLMTDGPSGVNLTLGSGRTSTALPAPITLAATWNPEAARRQGNIIATELRAAGMNVLLAPNVDLVRQPWWGRAAEEFGEDPLLISAMAVPFIQAVQSHAVVANVKHFLLYNQETNRLAGENSVADERTLNELYLPPFEAAIRQGQVGSVMGAFNQVNGVPACGNQELLNGLLKEKLGFRGWVMSDYGSTPSTVEAANAGLDQEMPGASDGDAYGGSSVSFFGGSLMEAARSGRVSLATLDDKVWRILRTMLSIGLFDALPAADAFSVADHADQARQIAAEGLVLLKNEAGILPLLPGQVRSIAVIGGEADFRAATGGASTVATPSHLTTPLAGLLARAARCGIAVQTAPGVDPVGPTSMLPGPAAVPSSVLTPAGAQPGEHGLRAEYWLNKDFSGTPVLERIDAQVNVDLGFLSQTLNASAVPPAPGKSGDDLSARWVGTITAPQTGDYRLSLTSLGSARLWLDGRLAIDVTEPHLLRIDSTPDLPLVAGEPHTLQIEYASTRPANWLEFGDVQLGWTHPADAYAPAMLEAAALARRADAAILIARTYESEQRDRATLTLPNDQDQLIWAVAEANPRTIVVLECAGPVTMPWLDHIAGVVYTGYAGQEQGAAIADILFGDVNPSGKLPLSFPRSETQVPVASPVQRAVELTTRYAEGVFVGYRAYDQRGLEPLFPFGHGLSYTTFAYSNLRLSTQALTPEARLIVSLDVTNTGQRVGQEVVQLYVRDVTASVPRPPKELKGFAKVALAPGETKEVTLGLDRAALAFWDEAQHAWTAEAGTFEVLVGSSSRDIRARAAFELTETCIFPREATAQREAIGGN